MKRRVVLINVIFLLVLATFSQAASIENAGFYNSVDEKITVVGLASHVPAKFVFDINSEDTINSFTIDLSQIYQGSSFDDPNGFYDLLNGVYRSSISLNTVTYCEPSQENADIMTCTVPGLRLRPQVDSIQVPISLSPATQVTYDAEFSFTTDSERPQAIEFTTDFCTNEGCYIAKDALSTINLEVQEANPLNPSRVQFRIGNIPGAFSNCEGNVCSTPFYYTGNCDGGDIVRARLTNSQDAVGNAFGNFDADFICDAQAPGSFRLPGENVNILVDFGEPPIPYPNFKNSDQIEIVAYVTEDASGVTALADLSSLEGDEAIEIDPENPYTDFEPGACAKQEGSASVYECRWTIDSAAAGTHTSTFVFFDGAGRESRPETVVTRIAEYAVDVDEDELDLYYDIDAVPSSTLGYSRLSIEIALDNLGEYPVYATFVPKQKSQRDEIDILKTTVTRCTYSGLYDSDDDGVEEVVTISGSTAAKIEIPENNRYYTYDDNQKRNSVDIIFLPGSLDTTTSNLNFNCEVEMIIVKDGVAFDSPTIFNMSIPIILKDSSLANLGARYAEKIQKKEEFVDSGIFNTIDDVSKVVKIFSDACNTVDKLATVTSAIRTSDTGVTICSASGAPAASGACQTVSSMLGKIGNLLAIPVDAVMGADSKSGATSLLSSSITSFLGGEDGEEGIFEKACKYATCSNEARANAKNLFGDDLIDETVFDNSDSGSDNEPTYLGSVGNAYKNDLVTGIGIPNPKESIISAIEARCIPAVVYHIEKYREMECEQLACYKWAGELGLDISTCDQQKDIAMCLAITSETFAVSPLKAVEDLADNFNNLVQNSLPSVIKNILSTYTCEALKAQKAAGPFGKLAYLTACELPKSIAQVSYQFTDNAQNNAGKFVYPTLNTCDFALCNAENFEDCANQGGTIPGFLAAAANSGIPDTAFEDILGVYDLSLAVVKSNMEAIIAPGFNLATATHRQRTILEAYVKLAPGESFDYDKAVSKAGKDKKEVAKLLDKVRGYARQLVQITEIADKTGGTLVATENGPTVSFYSVKVGDGKTYEDVLIESALAREKRDKAMQKVKDELNPSFYKDLTDAILLIQDPYATETTVDVDVTIQFENQNEKYSGQPIVIKNSVDGSLIKIQPKGVILSTNAFVERTEITTTTPITEFEYYYDSDTKKGEIISYELTSDSFVVDGKTVELEYYDVNVESEFNDISRSDSNKLLGAFELDKEVTDANYDVDVAKAIVTTHIEDVVSGVVAEFEKVDHTVEESELFEKSIEGAIANIDGNNVEQSDAALAQKRYERELQVQALMSLGSDMAAQYLFKTGALNKLQWDDGTGVGEFLDEVGDVLNSEKRKQLICNELTTINTADNQKANIVDCDKQGFCRAVLSFSAERIEMNSDVSEEGFLYVMTWSIGNVVRDDVLDPQLRGDDQFINYNVFLVGSGPELQLHQKDKWAKIPYGKNYDSIDTAIFNKESYDEICFRFDTEFPPRGATTGIGGNLEFCRSIQIPSEGDDFNTGEPTPDDYFQNNGNIQDDGGAGFTIFTEGGN